MDSNNCGISTSRQVHGAEIRLPTRSRPTPDLENQLPPGLDADNLKYPFRYNDTECVEDMCWGWQRFATEQDVYQNYGIQRRFGQEHQYFLVYKQRKICALYKKILLRDELGKLYENATPGDGLSRASSTLSIDNPLLDKFGEELWQYGQHIKLNRELKDFPRIPLREHKNLYEHMRLDHQFKEEECAYMTVPEDCLSTSTDQAHHVVERLIYEHPDCYMLWPFRMTRRKTAKFFNADSMNVIFKIMSIGLCEALLLTPIIVLYLVDLTKGQTIGAVSLFVFIFTSALAGPARVKLEVILLGLCGFMAVIVTFLNLNTACN